MKKITLFSILALAVMAIASCQKEKEVELNPGEVTITATRVANSTRSFLSEEYSEGGEVSYPVYWDAPDKILVGYAGMKPATFKSKNTKPAAEATFTGKLPEGEGLLYGIYPAESSNEIEDDYLALIIFHDEQDAVAGSFDPLAFPAVAVSESKNLSFMNVCGLVRLQVGSDNITKIDLTPTGNMLSTRVEAMPEAEVPEGLIGGTLAVSLDGGAPAIIDYETAIDHITLLAPEDEGTFNPDDVYYMVVPPCHIIDGVVFTLTHSDDSEEYVQFTGSVSVERNKVHDVGILGESTEPGGPDEPEPEPEYELAIERVWGQFPTEWPTFTGNLDRCATTDGEYVYVAKAGSDAKGVWAISISDPTDVKEVCMDGVDDEGTFYTSCVRTIYDPATKKYILLLCNLALSAYDHLYLYAYDKGIDSAPTKLLSSYQLPDWAERRFGDFFTVVGDWSNGYVYFRTNTSGASTTARFSIVNGALKSQTPDGFNYGYGASQGKGSFYLYDMSAKYGLLVTDSIGMFYDLNSAEGQEWNSPATTENMRRMFGITPFEFEGEKYIAYTKMKDDNAARSWLRIIKDKGTAADFKASLEENDIVYQAAIQIDEEGQSNNVMTGATYSNQTSASCAVAVMDDCVYIIGHHHNVGLSVFKMYMKEVTE